MNSKPRDSKVWNLCLTSNIWVLPEAAGMRGLAVPCVFLAVTLLNISAARAYSQATQEGTLSGPVSHETG